MNRLLALAALVLISPLLGAVYILVKITSPGPFIFKQTRAGKDKQPFTMYKIRTMYSGADKDQNKYIELNQANAPVFKIFNDPRFYRFGKFMAHAGIDELPQLVNIIRGEMAFIGPRPLPLNEAQQIPKKYNDRFGVLPGITSSWVIKGSHELSFDEWMELDCAYAKNHTMMGNLTIGIKTFVLIIQSMCRFLS